MLRSDRVDPVVFEVTVNIADVLFRQGAFEGAVEQYREALQMVVLPTGRAGLKTIHARVNYQLGLALSKLGRMDEAIRAYRKTLELKPDHRRALAGL